MQRTGDPAKTLEPK